MNEFKVNEYLTLKLVYNSTLIYVNNEVISHCKYLLLNVPSYKIIPDEDLDSMDKVGKILSRELELRSTPKELGLTPEEEFRAHCSNLQVWAENDYDPRLLHSNLAFPLLKKLTEAGDSTAQKVFKSEIANKFTAGHSSVASYLIEEGYFDYLNKREFITLLEDLDFRLINLGHLIDGIINYYKFKFGNKFIAQIIEEFPKNLMSDKLYFYFPLLKRLTEEGGEFVENKFKEEIAEKFKYGSYMEKYYLIRTGYLEYIDKEEFKVLLKELYYPIHRYTLKSHTDRVNSIAFSPDGKFLASAGGPFDKTIKIWDMQTGTLVKTLIGHISDVNTLAYSQDGKYIVSGSWDKTIKIWSVSSGTLYRTLQGHRSRLRSIAISSDMKYIVSTSGDNREEDFSIKIWDFKTGDLIYSFEDNNNEVNSIAISPDGKLIASGLNGKYNYSSTIKIWEFSTGTLVRRFKYSNSILSLVFSPNGKLLACGSNNGTITIWKVKNGELIRTLRGPKLNILSITFPPNGKFVISGSSDSKVKIWEIETGELVQTLIGHSSNVFMEQYWIYTVAVSLDGKYIASGSMDNSIKVWEIDFKYF